MEGGAIRGIPKCNDLFVFDRYVAAELWKKIHWGSGAGGKYVEGLV